MAFLKSLPPELGQMIVRELKQVDKAALAVSCRGNYVMANDALYESIDLCWKCNTSLEDLTPLLLLRTILRRPDLSEKVISLRIIGKRPEIPWRNPVSPNWCIADFEKILAIKRLAQTSVLQSEQRLGISRPNLMEHLIENGTAEFYQAVLISQLPALRFLDIGYDGHTDLPYLNLFSAHVLWSGGCPVSVPGFKRLRSINLYHKLGSDFRVGYEYEGRVVDEILPFFYLPDLKTLRGVMLDTTIAPVWTAGEPCADSLTTLKLDRCEVQFSILGEIFAKLPALQHLELNICREVDRVFMEKAPYIKCEGLSEAIHPLRQTLITIKLNVLLYHRDMDFSEPEILEGFEDAINFRDLTKLRDLEVPMLLLFGPWAISPSNFMDRLPPSLCTLALNDDMARFYSYQWLSGAVSECIENELDRSSSSSKSKLRELILCLRDGPLLWEDWQQAVLGQICNNAGLNFETHKQPRYFHHVDGVPKAESSKQDESSEQQESSEEEVSSTEEEDSDAEGLGDDKPVVPKFVMAKSLSFRSSI